MNNAEIYVNGVLVDSSKESKTYVDGALVSLEYYQEKLKTGCYTLSIDYAAREYRLNYSNELHLQRLRLKRKSLLIAFDKWEKAVLRGRADDSSVVMAWYQDLLDLKQTAFESIPDAVMYYL